ncbi:extracellular catalytic domain type 1 short-chain-length polyhydroxyalkanoate depolymerase [Sphingomonas aestuarii]
MLDAMRLMKSGDLASATAALQAGLSPHRSPNPDFTPTMDRNVIDLTPTRVTLRPSSDTVGSKAVPRQGVFSSERHGSTEYRLYIPTGAAEGLPLVVMLHGCTQTPEDFATATGMNALADELGFIVAYPRQPQSANPQKCWNWFRPGDQQRGRGEPAQIAGIVEDVVRDHRADPARVYVAGLSAGGAAAAIMAMRYPDVFAAVGIHSGLACGSAHDVPSAFSAMRRGGGIRDTANDGVIVPVITFHGDCDPTVHPINSEEIVAIAAARSRTPLTARTEYGGTKNGQTFEREISIDGAGRIVIEQWTIHGAGHAWSGGNAHGSFTNPTGPNASRAMIDFFLHHRLP